MHAPPPTALRKALCEVIRETKKIAESGSSESVQYLGNLSSDLLKFNDHLTRQLKSPSTQDVHLTEEERALHDLIVKCNEVASELTGYLDSVAVSKSKKWRAGAAFQAGVKTVWNKRQIDDLAQKLHDYREQVALRVLLLLNAHAMQQNQKLNTVEQSTREIVEAVSINHGLLQSRGRSLAPDGTIIGAEIHEAKRRHPELTAETFDRTLVRNLGDAKRNVSGESSQPRAEVMTTILTLRDRSSHTVVGPDLSASLSTQLSIPGNVQGVNTFEPSYPNAGKHKNFPSKERQPDVSGFTEKILEALNFRTITHRHASIEEAHQQTFQWIYEPPSANQKPWDDFSDWLKRGTGCYWINGKAGSGKSTLMKFVQGNLDTTTILNQWASASSSRLIVGSCYFWYAGTRLQRSQEGLLRSLLHDVLRQAPELVPVLFPSIFRSLLAGKLLGDLEFSFLEIKVAFMNFVRSVSGGYRVFFFVDGIDEYDGDHIELCELLKQVTTSSSVKMLLSSRPIPSCVTAFSGYPQLRVQDLTRMDIERYIEDKVGINPLMQRLESTDSGCTHQLTEGILSKAAGVFLWVILVVRRLLTGLQDYDTIQDLLDRLDELPPELEALYDHMLGSMSTSHRQQGSKLLQLVLRSSETHSDYPMTLFQLSYAEEEDYQKVINDPMSPISQEDMERRCEVIEGRMRSRCCGLIEAQESLSTYGPYKSERIASFLHKTVEEFLRSKDIWPRISLLTRGTRFDVNKALLGSSLKELGAIPPTRLQSTLETIVWAREWSLDSLLRILRYEHEMKREMRQLFLEEYLPVLIFTVISAWGTQEEVDPSQRVTKEAYAVATSQSRNEFDLPWPQSFLLLAAHYLPPRNLGDLLPVALYAEALEALDTSHSQLQFRAYLLVRFVNENRAEARSSLLSNMRRLSEHDHYKVDVNRAIRFQSKSHIWKSHWNHALRSKSWTIWEFILHFLYSRMRDTRQHIRFVQGPWGDWVFAFLDFLNDLLGRGAAMNQTISVKGYKTGVEISASVVIEAVLSSVWRDASSHPLQFLPVSNNESIMDTIAGHFSQIEGSLRDKGAQKIIRIVPLKTTAHTLSLANLSNRLKRHRGVEVGTIENRSSDASDLPQRLDITRLSRKERAALEAVGLRIEDMGTSPWTQHQEKP